MSIQKLKDALAKINEDIRYLQTENLVLDRTISKMEQREREIETSLPAFTYKFPWEKDNTIKAVKLLNIDEVCRDELSSDEELPDDGVYVPVIPENELDFNDPYFDALSDNTKEAITMYMHNIGEVAPSNFDVFRHNYGDLVKKGKEDSIRLKEDPNSSNFHKELNEHKKVSLLSAATYRVPWRL